MSLLKTKNYREGNSWTNFTFTRVFPYFRFIGRDKLLFSQNERFFSNISRSVQQGVHKNLKLS